MRLRPQAADQALFEGHERLGAEPVAQGLQAAELQERHLQLLAGGARGLDQGAGGGLEAGLVVQVMSGLGGGPALGAGDRTAVSRHLERGHRGGALAALLAGQADHDRAATAAVLQAVQQGGDHHPVARIDEVAPGAPDEIGLGRPGQRLAGPDGQGDATVRRQLQQEIRTREGEAEQALRS